MPYRFIRRPSETFRKKPFPWDAMHVPSSGQPKGRTGIAGRRLRLRRHVAVTQTAAAKQRSCRAQLVLGVDSHQLRSLGIEARVTMLVFVRHRKRSSSNECYHLCTTQSPTTGSWLPTRSKPHSGTVTTNRRALQSVGQPSPQSPATVKSVFQLPHTLQCSPTPSPGSRADTPARSSCGCGTGACAPP